MLAVNSHREISSENLGEIAMQHLRAIAKEDEYEILDDELSVKPCEFIPMENCSSRFGFHKFGPALFPIKNNRMDFVRCCRGCAKVVAYRVTQTATGHLKVHLVETLLKRNKTELRLNR